ncbi:pilus assembly protein PilN [Burkholderia gladioli]|uniref:pilus assembly protein PilN n=1 Tax=Burkholderia gladioli TaxID=28095 RepID=UPI00264B96D3|nr:pilus assembly protein PilN [Burkholderia gladioli]MDN7465825.1 pilus assembly protein PilN [Burkholderia gladioli]
MMRVVALSFACCLAFQGCAVKEIRDAQDETISRASATAQSGQPVQDVVQFSDDAWLMGQQVPTVTSSPAIYDQPVDFNYPANTLQDLARWIRQVAGVRVVIDPSVNDNQSSSAALSLSAATTSKNVLPPLPPGVPGLPASLSLSSTSFPTIQGSSSSTPAPLRPYKGTLGGLLKLQAARFGVWEKYENGAITFFKTEMRTFPLPTIDDLTKLDGTITTSSGSDTSAGTNTSSSSGGGNSQTSEVHLQIKPFKTLEATATAVAQGGKVVVDNDLGILVVTGTPPQCDAVEAFMKSLNATYGKIIAFDVALYSVEMTRGENYGVNLALAYKSATGHTSASITGAPAPTISGGGTGFSMGGNILSGPFAGTQGALKLLSTIGNVTSEIHYPGTTLNGKKTLIQDAEKQGYLPSQQSTLAANVGTSISSQAQFVTTGFTGQIVPKLINGSIALDMTLTLNRLIGMDLLPAGCTGSSCLETPHTKNYDLQAFANLKPGESLMLVGMQKNETTTTNNGVGNPYMPLLGGGVDANQQRTILAIVVTARVQ